MVELNQSTEPNVTGTPAPARTGATRTKIVARRGLPATVVAGLISAANVGTANAAGPCDIPGVSLFCSAGGGLVNAAVGGTFDKIVDSMNTAMGRMLELAMSWWIAMPSPKLGTGDDSILGIVKDYTLELQLVGMIVSLIFVALRMAVSRKGLVEESEAAWTSLIRAVFTTTMFTSFVMLGTAIGDAFSNWVLGSVVLQGKSGKEAIEAMQLATMKGLLPPAGIGVIALIGFLGALLQLFLLVIRQAMLIVVMALMPIAATWAGTGPGSQAYQKLQGWVIAFLLFKPVGALVYVVAFTAAGTPTQDEQMKLLGIVLFTMTAFVLPSLMKLVAPAIGAMGGGGSGLAAAGMVAGAALAAGKVAGMAATGGASGAAGAGAGVSSIASRGGGAAGGASGGGPTSGGPSPSPGPKPAIGGGPGGGKSTGSPAAGQSSGRNPGPSKSSVPGGGGGGVAAAQLAQNAASGEANASAPPTPISANAAGERPHLQSGYGAHAMKG